MKLIPLAFMIGLSRPVTKNIAALITVLAWLKKIGGRSKMGIEGIPTSSTKILADSLAN